MTFFCGLNQEACLWSVIMRRFKFSLLNIISTIAVVAVSLSWLIQQHQISVVKSSLENARGKLREQSYKDARLPIEYQVSGELITHSDDVCVLLIRIHTTSPHILMVDVGPWGSKDQSWYLPTDGPWPEHITQAAVIMTKISPTEVKVSVDTPSFQHSFLETVRIGTVISDTLQGWGTSGAYLDGMGVEPETIFEWAGSEKIVIRFKRKLDSKSMD